MTRFRSSTIRPRNLTQVTETKQFNSTVGTVLWKIGVKRNEDSIMSWVGLRRSETDRVSVFAYFKKSDIQSVCFYCTTSAILNHQVVRMLCICGTLTPVVHFW